MSQLRGKKSAVYGELTRTNGSGAPVEVLGPIDRAGYGPERLDTVIETFINNADAGSTLIQQFAPMLGVMMQKAQTELTSALKAISAPETPPEGETPKDDPMRRFSALVEVSDGVARILERVAKITKQAVESMDDATRLRAFIVGIEEQDDGGLAGKGENELRKLVLDAASGWQKAIE